MPVPEVPASQLSAAALAEVGRDPSVALGHADTALLAARRQRDPAAASTAHRAASLALRELGDIPGALARARSAVRVAMTAGAGQQEAEARMSLAYVLLELGRLRAALNQADRAGGAVTGLSASRVASQRALILQRSGRLDEALSLYATSLPVFRRHHDKYWEAILHNNRGLLHADKGNLDAAESDLGDAAALYTELDLTLMAAEAVWNLGIVATRRGDVPRALAFFDRAEEQFVTGSQKWQILIHRSEVLLSVGLWDEGRRTAEKAVAELAETDQITDLAEARLMLAQACAAAGDPQEAKAQGTAARALFLRSGRAGWARLSGLVALRASETDGTNPREVLRAALACAAELSAAGWPIAEMDARLIAARAAQRVGNLKSARSQLQLAARSQRLGPIELRMRAHYARALLCEASGDRRGAKSALTAGLRLLDDFQSVLGAAELRAHVSAIGSQLVAKGLDLALTSGNPREVLTWSDQWRARSLRPRPVRPPRDPELTAALADVRRLNSETVNAQLGGRPAPLITERWAAERRVVTTSRRAAAVHSGAKHRPGPAESVLVLPVRQAPANLADALDGKALVEFVEHSGRLYAVTLIDGRHRLVQLGMVNQPRALTGSVHFMLRRLATRFGSDRSLQLMAQSARHNGAELERQLFGPIRDGLGDRELVIVPSASLHSVPWSLLPALAQRPFRISPSAAAWVQARAVPPMALDSAEVFAAGPGLPTAAAELTQLAGASRHPVLLTADLATADNVLAALDGAALAHIAAHGVLRTDNPLFSALMLHDGPLTVYDLEGLQVAPRVVVLPACESGVSAVHAGDELLGLVAALLGMGTVSVIATGISVPDASTATLMTHLHRHLNAGAEAAAALASARGSGDRSDPGFLATAAGFTCYGA